MVKKKEKETSKIIAVCTVTFIGLFILIVASTLWIYSQMPKNVCHEEYEVVRIKTNCNAYENQYIPANAERICDDGVMGGTELLDYRQIVADCNFDDIDRYCMYKKVNEVCEVVYP